MFPPPFPNPIWSFSYPGPTDESTLVLARPDVPQLFILNPSAAFIWSTVAHSPTIVSLISKYATHYQIPYAQASADIHTTLDSWSETLLAPAHPPTFPPRTPPPIPSTQPHFSAHYKYANFYFRLAIHDPDFADEILPRLAHLLSEPGPVTSTTTFHALRAADHLHILTNSTPLTVQSDSSVARTILLQEIGRLAHTPDTQFVGILHAAAVGSPTQAILLAAPTNSGKSTLAAALTHAGFHLFSDDSAPIDPSFNVIPAPFAFMLRAGSWPILSSYFPNLTSAPIIKRYGEPVRFLPPHSVLELASAFPKTIIYINYQPGALLALQPLNAFESLLEVQKAGFYFPHTESAIAAFLAWFQMLPAYRLSYSALPATVDLLKRMFF